MVVHRRWTFAVSVLGLSLYCGAAAAQSAVAARHLRPGTVLAAGDMRPAGDGADPTLEALVGLEVRRAVYAGRPILPGDVGPPTLVARNALVAIVYQTGGLGIRADGRALDAGAAGERIRVMNLSSRLVVQGIVSGPGMIEVTR